MRISFYKYQGTGNDFIMLDNRDGLYGSISNKQVEALCNRQFGIGADGLILLENKPGFDFSMVYYNSDGKLSSMCGNGGRCITAFARLLKIVDSKAKFDAADGEHEALIIQDSPVVVKLKMGDVRNLEMIGDDVFLNTGSPHYVRFVSDVEKVDLMNEARSIRYNMRFSNEGTNVNFVQTLNDGIAVRSYERGVEGETLSCGTGVTASVLASVSTGKINSSVNKCKVESQGGMLNVYFQSAASGFTDVWLEGPATLVFKGEIEI